MTTIMVYSEAGGVTKTTTAVSLAMVAALSGFKTTLIDLDPRGAATKWIGSYPEESWQHVGAILADENPEGWAEDLAIDSGWDDNLRIIPSSRSLSNRERDYEDHAELRLATALEGHTAEIRIIDCPTAKVERLRKMRSPPATRSSTPQPRIKTGSTALKVRKSPSQSSAKAAK